MIITPESIASYTAAAIGVHATAVAVVNLTPTPKDNDRLGQYTALFVKIYRAIEILAGIITPLVKK
jgi:hypothetical protein